MNEGLSMAETLESRVHVAGITHILQSINTVSWIFSYFKDYILRVKFSSFHFFTAIFMCDIFVHTSL